MIVARAQIRCYSDAASSSGDVHSVLSVGSRVEEINMYPTHPTSPAYGIDA